VSDPGHTKPPVEFAVAQDGTGWAVTLNGRVARTPARNPLVVPSAALARAIADELAADARLQAGRGLAALKAGSLFRLAAGAIDVIGAEQGGRARTIGEIAAYGGTDLLSYRAEGPDELVRRQNAAWDPLLAWFAKRFGAELACAAAVTPLAQDPRALEAVKAAVGAYDDFVLAGLALATTVAGSVVIALALIDGESDAETACAAATLDETFQLEKWGRDAEAETRLDALHHDLEQAARFVGLLRDSGDAN
jgi:chaperone required for assembly of F1-ATPase